MGWQIPATELDKLADPEVKAFFLCNPSNLASVRMLPATMTKLVELVNNTTIDLLRLAIEQYGSDFVEYLVKHFHPLDFVFQLAEAQGIVLLPGGGFEAPQWSVRVSLANLPDAAYSQIGLAIAHLMKTCYDEWKTED